MLCYAVVHTHTHTHSSLTCSGYSALDLIIPPSNLGTVLTQLASSQTSILVPGEIKLSPMAGTITNITGLLACLLACLPEDPFLSICSSLGMSAHEETYYDGSGSSLPNQPSLKIEYHVRWMDVLILHRLRSFCQLIIRSLDDYLLTK